MAAQGERIAGGFILLTGIDGTRFAVRQQAVAVILDADECHDETIVQLHGGHVVRISCPLDETLSWFAAATRADIRHGGNRAYYAIDADRVQLQPFESFRDTEGYYATLLHELTHWTRHPARLAREFGRKRWGDAGYAAEELVAELGAAFLCADLGVSPEPRDDHASYIASWLEV